ncbi:MAG: saccharopine dehydrogenase NADP-binding domain-containing protein [Candidatus Cloacimonetes bacterium]|nr:saccharopine dehydrogenase NADP-binding domain-containing protein [Candidatus Cloacimonadota bacterium]
MAQKVMIFGAGLVSKPMVVYLAENGFEVTIGNRHLEKAAKLAKLHPNITAVQVDVTDDELMNKLVVEHDISVSLLPAVYHPIVAALCIKNKKNMVTASYVSPAMSELNDQAVKAGIIILNEIGVDPGIDHMSAMKIFDEVKDKGGKIVSFMSYCGGLPAPKDNTNPLGYKFSWAPKGVLIAAGNNAQYLRDGEIVDVPGKNLFSHYWLVDIPGMGTYEAYPNRDSLSYIETYGLEGIKTIYRGTFRNISHCETWYSLAQLGFFNKDGEVFDTRNMSVSEFIKTKMLGLAKDDCLKCAIAKKLNLNDSSIVLKKFQWLGFFDKDYQVPCEKGAAIDVLTAIMLEKMSYEPGELDLLLMHHEFIAEYQDNTQQRITSTMIDFGIPNGDTSMARTVSLPAAIAVKMILDGKITHKGVKRPIDRDVYLPVLAELEEMNIKLVERFY